MKKILTVLAGIFLILSTISFAFAIGNTFNSDNTIIIYGEKAATSDVTGATDISKEIVGVTTTITTTTVLGNESVLMRGHGDDLNFGDILSSVVTKFTDKDLPGILADGSVEYDDGSEEDYTQTLTFGDNKISFDSLAEEDYIDTNSSIASKEIPIIYLDLDGYLWNLEIEFDDPLDATDLDDNAIINIAGKEYTFKLDMEEDDNELVLYASSEKINLELNEVKTVTIGGESVTLELIGADDDDDEIFIEVDGELEKVKEGKSLGINGERIYVENVFIRTIPEYKVSAELFIGAEELTIDNIVSDSGEDFKVIEINGNDLDGMKAKVITANGTIDKIKSIEFQFSPIDMEDVEDEIQFLEVGESITDPLFETISIIFESIDMELDSEDRDFVELKALGDELEITFTNVDGNEIKFIPYEVKNDILDSTLLVPIGEIITIDSETDEDRIFIVKVSKDITEVFRIEDIKDDEIEIYSYTEDDSKEYSNNDKLENTDITINFDEIEEEIIITLTGEELIAPVLWTENLMKIELGEVIDLIAEISFIEEMDDDEDPEKATITTKISIDNDKDIIIGKITSEGEDITQDSDDNGDYEYTVTNGFATYFIREDEDDSYLKVYVPEEETDFNVYVSDSVSIKETIEGEEISLAIKDADLPEEGWDSIKNMIIVGGPCINEIAAELLGSSEPICGEDFTELTGVNAGKYLYQVFEDYDLTSESLNKIIILIAGYHAEDTTRGVKEFLEGDFDLTIGTKIIN